MTTQTGERADDSHRGRRPHGAAHADELLDPLRDVVRTSCTARRRLPVRLFGENYVAFRAEDGRIGFLDELCPHRRSSLLLARIEGNGLRCIYHGWKIDVSGCVVECPNQALRAEQFAASVNGHPLPRSGVRRHRLGVARRRRGAALPGAPLRRPGPVPLLVRFAGPLQLAPGDRGHHRLLPCRPAAPDVDRRGRQDGRALESHLRPRPTANLRDAVDPPMGCGRRRCARRPMVGTYVRITEHLMPLVTVTPIGRAMPRAGSVFVISPWTTPTTSSSSGTSETRRIAPRHPTRSPWRHPTTCLTPTITPDCEAIAVTAGGRTARSWIPGTSPASDGACSRRTSSSRPAWAPIVDRTRETLSSSDVAVAHARRMLLDALSAAEAGRLPPGSALTPEAVRLPNALEVLVGEGERWEDSALDQVTS